jgi:Zinc knuckle
MSDESPRNLSDRLRSAFSFEDVSPVYDIDVDGHVVPAQQSDESVSSNETRSDTISRPRSDSNSSGSSSSMTTPGGNSVTINGRVINVSSTAQVISSGSTPLFKKENRVQLSEDKRNDLFDKATKVRTTKFDLLTLTLSEEDKLDDTYNIGIQIAQLRSHFIKFDMDDVFTIVTPMYNPVSQSTVLGPTFNDLFTSYSQISEDKVASSNKWYNEHTVEDYYRQNLQLTFEFFENNCTKGLWEKCLEDYDEYEPEEKGGPLLFIIMMKKLQSHTDSAVQYLINSVKNLKISNFEGENVSRVVSLIRGANKRLKNVTTLPEEFPKWVLLVLQTSSVEGFNTAFSHIKREIEVVTPLRMRTSIPIYPPIEDMLRMAEKLYLDMTAANEWTGVTTKVNQSAFAASSNTGRKLTCWNCGVEGHSLKECKQAENRTMIEKFKKEFNDAKNKKKKDNEKKAKDKDKTIPIGKWAPPSKGENGKRTIDGIPRFWLDRTKRWVKDKDAPENAPPCAHVATATVPTVPSSNVSGITTVAGTTATTTGRELAIANAAHSINLAMNGLVNTFRDM